MHPNHAFDWTDEAAMLDFIERQVFATIALPAPGVVHAPVIVRDRSILFHVARRNRMADQIAGQRLMISVLGRNGYQSANWYVSPNQVPTWHYETVEVEGVARDLDQEELSQQVDTLSDVMEARYQPSNPWTKAKMEPGRYEATLRAIRGFEVPIEAIRGTRKFDQHKKAADAEAAIAGLRSAGEEAIAQAVEEHRQ